MSTTYKITLLPGDGIGPEVITEAVNVLDAVATASGFNLSYNEQHAGEDAGGFDACADFFGEGGTFSGGVVCDGV